MEENITIRTCNKRFTLSVRIRWVMVRPWPMNAKSASERIPVWFLPSIFRFPAKPKGSESNIYRDLLTCFTRNWSPVADFLPTLSLPDFSCTSSGDFLPEITSSSREEKTVSFLQPGKGITIVFLPRRSIIRPLINSFKVLLLFYKNNL